RPALGSIPQGRPGRAEGPGSEQGITGPAAGHAAAPGPGVAPDRRDSPGDRRPQTCPKGTPGRFLDESPPGLLPDAAAASPGKPGRRLLPSRRCPAPG